MREKKRERAHAPRVLKTRTSAPRVLGPRVVKTEKKLVAQRTRSKAKNLTKKDGTVRWVSDLRELNKVVKKTQYTLPVITDVLRRREVMNFQQKLDISICDVLHLYIG